MARDVSLPLRIAAIVAMKADAAISALVADRVEQQPDANQIWPYVVYGVALITPNRSTGQDGSNTDMTIHAFGAGETNDECAELSAAVSTCLDGKVLALDTNFPATCKDIRWTGTQILRDTVRADGWHGIITFVATVVS